MDWERYKSLCDSPQVFSRWMIEQSVELAKEVRRGQLIILESTTYPGTTDEVILPKLEATGRKVGEDFFLAFSPERVDPGNDYFLRAKNLYDAARRAGNHSQKIAAAATFSCAKMPRIRPAPKSRL